jgi:hypothetical protein
VRKHTTTQNIDQARNKMNLSGVKEIAQSFKDQNALTVNNPLHHQHQYPKPGHNISLSSSKMSLNSKVLSRKNMVQKVVISSSNIQTDTINELQDAQISFSEFDNIQQKV